MRNRTTPVWIVIFVAWLIVPGGWTGAASLRAAEQPTFLRDALPLFHKLGCSAVACHGSAQGKSGFHLSMFGGEPDFDYDALVRAHQGRRVNRVEPGKSLFLVKATNAVPHAGGARIQPDSAEYAMLVSWVAQGVPYGDDARDRPVSVVVSPKDAALPKGQSTQLAVQATYADGSVRDVTLLASFTVGDPAVATVDGAGKVTGDNPGETFVNAYFMRRSDTVRVLCPQTLPVPFQKPDANNRIDELVFAKLEKLGIPPSEPCSEEVFLRRAYLDVIGTLPKPDETRAFLSDVDPVKRAKLIDRLLERDEYADHWALKWGDLLRIKSEYPVRVWPRGVQTYYRWVRGSIAANKPYDQFVRELLTANGGNFTVGPANYFRAVANRDARTYAEAAAVLFLGARLDCVRCHAHPTENWSLDDALGMAAFFSKVAVKTTQEWKEEIVYFNRHGAVWHPKSRQYVNPKSLGAEAMDLPHDQDPRPKFAEWLTSPQNPLFAKVMANRVWYWLLDRGIVHEPDDFRSTNAPSDPELLDYLAKEFVESKFDVKHVFRLILNSKTYQLSSKPNEFNRTDRAHFSHYYVRRMAAEQLLDAVCQVTATSDQFVSWIPVPPTVMPAGSRAAQVFDGDIRNPLLDLFGRPTRDTPYECARTRGGSVRQSLHLVNSDHFEGKVAGSPALQQMFQANKSDAEIIDELYLATLSRLPRPDEKQRVLDYMAGAGKAVPPELEVDRKSAEAALASAQAALAQASAGYDAAEMSAKEADAATAAAAAAASAAGAAHTAAEQSAAAQRQQAAKAKAHEDELVRTQLSPAEAKLAQFAQALTEAANAKAAADQMLANANNTVAQAQQAADAAEKAAQEAESVAKAVAEDGSKADAEKQAAAADAAAKRKSAEDAKVQLSQTQQQQQQAQVDATAAGQRLTQAEAEKNAAENVATTARQQVAPLTSVREVADNTAQAADAAAAAAKAAAYNARTVEVAATAAGNDQRRMANEAQAARDKLAADEKAAAEKLADANKKLADAAAALKPPRHQAIQDLLWALLNTKEFLFNH